MAGIVRKFSGYILSAFCGAAAICGACFLLSQLGRPDLRLDLEYRPEPPQLVARFTNKGRGALTVDLTGVYAFTRKSQTMPDTFILHLKNDVTAAPVKQTLVMYPGDFLEIDSLLPQLDRLDPGIVALVAEYDMPEWLGREREVWRGTVRSAPLRLNTVPGNGSVKR